VTQMLRVFVGCAAVGVAALFLRPAPAANDTPDLPAASVKKAADADLKFVQGRVADLAMKQKGGAKLLDGQIKPALGASLMIAVYADILGDKALKDGIVKVAEAIAKKDFATADDAAKKLTVKPGTPGKPGPLPAPFKTEVMLEAVMQPFRPSAIGGLNIDKDIKELSKANMPGKIDPAALEVLGVRSAVINAYGLAHANQKAKTNAANEKLWNKWSTDSVDLSKKIAVEAGKGAKSNEKDLRTMLGALMRNCNDCHEKFRDD